MTREEFKTRWESNEDGGGITFNEIAECSKSWGLFNSPRTSQMDAVLYSVLSAANVVDAEDYAPEVVE